MPDEKQPTQVISEQERIKNLPIQQSYVHIPIDHQRCTESKRIQWHQARDAKSLWSKFKLLYSQKGRGIALLHHFNFKCSHRIFRHLKYLLRHFNWIYRTSQPTLPGMGLARGRFDGMTARRLLRLENEYWVPAKRILCNNPSRFEDYVGWGTRCL